MSRQPRVVHVTTTDISLALLLGPQLAAFRAAGYEVIGASAPGPYVERLAALGVTHVPLRYATRSMAPLRDVAALGELTRVFSRLRPDIVHTHNPKPGVYGRLAARLARVPVVVNTVHGLYAQPGDRWARRTVVYGLERIAAKCSQAELCQNVEDIPVLERLGVPSRKLHLLGNGIDLDQFDPANVSAGARKSLRSSWNIPDDAIVCGVVGRLVWEKGYREVIEAASMLRADVPDLHIVVVGMRDVAKAEALSAADIDAAHALGNIHFVGESDDMASCYAAFDLYALASYREGFPRSAMEAAAMGLPVVATDIRGCRQVVDRGQTGLLVRPRDAAALAEAIRTVATDFVLRSEMADAAYAKARVDFDQRRCIDITLRVVRVAAGRRLPEGRRMTDGRIRLAELDDAWRLADMHARRINEGFLASLGPVFLGRLYRRVVRSPRAFAMVAEENGRVVAFCAAAENVGRLYREFMVRDGIQAGVASAPRLVRSLPHVLQTLRYPATTGELPDAEILAVVTDTEVASKGWGSLVLHETLDELERRGCSSVKVVAGASNESALRLYGRCGFAPLQQISIHDDVQSEVLVWASS